MSSVIVVNGRLGRDAEFSTTKKGTKVAKMSLASDTGFGENKVTTWYRVSVFGDSVQFVERFGKKGKAFTVTGEHYVRQYTGRDGSPKESNEIRAFNVSFASDGQSKPNGGNQGYGQNHWQGYAPQPQQGYPPQGVPGYPQPAAYPAQGNYPAAQPQGYSPIADAGSLREDTDFALQDASAILSGADDAEVPF